MKISKLEKPLTAVLTELSANRCIIVQDHYEGLVRRATRISGRKIEVIDLSDCNSVIQHDKEDQLVTVETGIKLSDLDQILSKQNQWFPIITNNNATLLDIINSGEGGCLEHGFGGPSKLILGMNVALVSGDSIRTGGKVVKNVTGFNLTKLFIGAQGTLGVPYEAHLRLYARPEKHASFLIEAESICDLLKVTCLCQASSLPIAGIDIFSRSSQTASFIVTLCDNEQVLNEVIDHLQMILKESKYQLLTDTAQAPVMQYLQNNMTTGNEHFIETTLSIREANEFFTSIKEMHGEWHFSPGTGKLRILSATKEFKEDCISLLRTLAKNRQPLTVAYSDESWDYVVTQLPKEDAVTSQIKTRLKDQFDPEGVLNPFARP